MTSRADLEAVVGDLVAGWGAGPVSVAVRLGGGEALTIGDPGRRFRLASITKLFSAVATLVAVEEEAVALTDPAGPEGSTVEHLLAHASGLGFDTTEPLAAPGQRRIYSSAGYEALGAAVTTATGIDFDTYATEAVLLPLGLEDTIVTGSPAAGWWSTARDVLVLVDQVRRSTLLAPETMTRATTVAFPGLAGVLPGVGRMDPLDWGLGFEIRDGKARHWTGATNSAQTVGHFGGSGTFAWYDPQADVACVALTERAFGDWALQAWPKLSDLVLTNAAPEPT